MSGFCKDRVVIVSGAGAGLGRAYALALAEAKAKVVVNDVHADRAAEVVDSIQQAGGTALAQSGDIADFMTAEEVVHKTLEVFGGLHVVINNGARRSSCFRCRAPSAPVLPHPARYLQQIRALQAPSAPACRG